MFFRDFSTPQNYTLANKYANIIYPKFYFWKTFYNPKIFKYLIYRVLSETFGQLYYKRKADHLFKSDNKVETQYTDYCPQQLFICRKYREREAARNRNRASLRHRATRLH